MPKKSEITALTGLPKDIDKSLVVQKSRPLYTLWQSELPLTAFKIMDAYLARIDSHNPENRTVRFTKGELERVLGITQLKKQDLEARLKKLYTAVPLTKDPRKIHHVVLFSESYAEQDENDQWEIQLTCTPEAMKYFFNVDKMGYFRYQLRSITSITSRYSYILFMHLEMNRDWKNEWVVPLNELKEMLHCDKDPTYKQFKRFNDLVLKKCHKDLHEKTECRFSYETVKKGKYVVGVRFKLEELGKALSAPAPAADPQDEVIEIDEWNDDIDDLDKDNVREKICLGFSDKVFAHLTDEQLMALKELARTKVPKQLIDDHAKIIPLASAVQWATSEYLEQAVLTAKTRVRNPEKLFAYVKKMVENDKNA